MGAAVYTIRGLSEIKSKSRASFLQVRHLWCSNKAVSLASRKSHRVQIKERVLYKRMYTNKNNQTSCFLQLFPVCGGKTLKKPAGQLFCGLTGVAKPCGLSRISDSFHVEHQKTGLCEEFLTSSWRYPKPLTNQATTQKTNWSTDIHWCVLSTQQIVAWFFLLFSLHWHIEDKIGFELE